MRKQLIRCPMKTALREPKREDKQQNQVLTTSFTNDRNSMSMHFT